ncbi:hypothetical protein Patl1_20516 [Pistacia atlantica]|uniref:Uncharacterized protein n=1 Tax=Pistacia atlantica TaxID=434234 RepID=A0ACC1BHM2_9ROSI|nr:hypothetical protein Patl1_20516 [Pistacia atlantica]
MMFFRLGILSTISICGEFEYIYCLTNILYISAYYAQVAGLYYGLHHTDNGFQAELSPGTMAGVSHVVWSSLKKKVTLVGYNHKLRILLETVVQKIAEFKVKPDRFSVIKVMTDGSYAQNMPPL